MREEPRAGDVYAWSWPARPVGDDPYQWRGPVQAQIAPPTMDFAPAPQPAAAGVAEAAEPETSLEAAPAVESEELWVELPTAEEAPRKARSRRGRGGGRSAGAVDGGDHAAAQPATEPLVAANAPAAETLIAPESPSFADPAEPEADEPPHDASHAMAPADVEAVAEAVAETVAEPEAALAPAEPAPRPYVADEIVAPPASPRRGWWRRGA
jgi:ribonuclease E